MGSKEAGLLTGTFVFFGMFILAAVIIGQYVHFRTKDRSQADDNRKYDKYLRV